MLPDRRLDYEAKVSDPGVGITLGPSDDRPPTPNTVGWLPVVLVIGVVALLWALPTEPVRVNPTRDRQGVERPTIAVDPSSSTMSPDWQLLDRGPLSPRWPAVTAWTNEELVIWGGVVFRGSRLLGDGAAYNPATGSWRRLAPSPLGKVQQAQSLWTGHELVVRSTDGLTTEDVTAGWDPASNSWRPVGEWPLRGRSSETLVWTGSMIIDVAASTATDLASGDTRPIAGSPYRTGSSSLWTGSEVLVLPGGAYDPIADTWRPVRRGPLGSNATAAAWLENRAVVVDSELNSAVYHPDSDSWSSLPDLPLPSLGCDPRIHTAGRTIIAEICGDIALLDAAAGTWMPLAPPRSLETNTVVTGGDQLYEWGEGFYVLRNWLAAGWQPSRLMVGTTALDVPNGWTVRRTDLVAPDHTEVLLGGPADENCTASSLRRGARLESATDASMTWQVSEREVFQLSCHPASVAATVAEGVIVPSQ